MRSGPPDHPNTHSNSSFSLFIRSVLSSAARCWMPDAHPVPLDTEPLLRQSQVSLTPMPFLPSSISQISGELLEALPPNVTHLLLNRCQLVAEVEEVPPRLQLLWRQHDHAGLTSAEWRGHDLSGAQPEPKVLPMLLEGVPQHLQISQ